MAIILYKVVLDKNIKTFVLYIIIFSYFSILIYLVKKTWIVLLLVKKIIILKKYL